MLWLRKWDVMSQFVLGKSAKGAPQVDGSGLALGLEMSLGMEERGKNQTRMPSFLSSVAYTCSDRLASMSIPGGLIARLPLPHWR